jgi:iron complex transport system substrate-binding protein
VRICSLLPSATEIVADLGLVDALVGRSEECDWPDAVRALPVVTAARIRTSELSSLEIDEAVRAAVAEGRSLYAVDERLVEELAPEVVITQDLCEVCAVSSGELRGLSGLGAEIVTLDARTIDGIAESVIVLARRLGVPERGEAVAGGLRETIAEVERAVAGAPRRRVFLAEWLDPPYAAGHWVPEMVAHAGGEDVLGRPGQPSYPTTWDEVLACEPELVVLAPCGLDAPTAAREAALLDLPCRAVAVDGASYYSRPAPRVAEGVRQLAFLLHPERAADPGLPWLEVSPRA